MPSKPSVVAVGLPLELDTVRQENRNFIARFLSTLEAEPDLAQRFCQLLVRVERYPNDPPLKIAAG